MRRHRYLRNRYAGQTAYLLSCGPSLEKVWNNRLHEFLRKRLVISVKQAHDLAPEISDFHLYNEIRMKPYRYPGPTIRISVSQFQSRHPPHIHYPIHAYRYESALFVTNDYDRWCMEKSFIRPWGVGILFEIGLQLPVYLGCKRILIIGFDMNPKGKYHFYDDDQQQDSRHYGVDEEEFDYAAKSIGHYLNWVETKGVEVKLHSPLSALPMPEIADIYNW